MPPTTPTKDVTPREELLAVHEIQGNILAGFNKDHQHFLFLRIHDREIAKRWLQTLAPRIATTAEVLAFNRLYRSLRTRAGGDPQGLSATWINLAFTISGLAKLTSPQAVAAFEHLDFPFYAGLQQRSTLLGDPTAATEEGHTSHWRVGGENNPVDLLLMIASDQPDLLAQTVAGLQAELAALPLTANGKLALEPIFEQPAEARADKPGHEHFGFKDSVSQPGVRGRVSRAAGDFLTPRLLRPDDPLAPQLARPGQPLLWPGQFILGYQTQNNQHPTQPGPLLRPRPAWTRNGSFLVVRRLKQNVTGFWQFLTVTAAQLASRPGFAGMTAERLGTLLVGRWPSGAPLMRAPLADSAALARDGLANNHFFYGVDTPPLALTVPTYPGDNFPQAREDFLGAVCPHFAHVRKVNPRDMGTDTGGANDTLTRLILRRGIPFGTPMADPLQPTPTDLHGERGLMFLCYQSSIANQFEFLMTHWTNSPNQPQAGGIDPIIGQREDALGKRIRQLELQGTDGSKETIMWPADWVIPTGGDYFFAPSISALTKTLAR